MKRSLILTVISLVVITAPLMGQAPKWRSVFTINPLGLPAEYFSAELETMSSEIVSVGVSASYFGPSDVSYSTLEGKLRLYPNEEGPKGFSLGVSAGVTHVSEDGDAGAGFSGHSATKPTIGAIVDYNWLLGKTSKVLVGTGIGVKRLFGKEGDFNDVSFFYPTVRFQVGLRF